MEKVLENTIWRAEEKVTVLGEYLILQNDKQIKQVDFCQLNKIKLKHLKRKYSKVD